MTREGCVRVLTCTGTKLESCFVVAKGQDDCSRITFQTMNRVNIGKEFFAEWIH